jgi:hypothetical protein
MDAVVADTDTIWLRRALCTDTTRQEPDAIRGSGAIATYGLFDRLNDGDFLLEQIVGQIGERHALSRRKLS